jgi:Cu+-exporting ATPase
MEVALAIGGMTCASSAARIERKLNRLDGAYATVNYATEKATVHHPPTVTRDELVATVARAGYTATVHPPAEADDPVRTLRRRVLVSLALTVPVVALAMVPGWRFPGWGWMSLALAAPVVAYGG